jgi:hypothetical protein
MLETLLFATASVVAPVEEARACETDAWGDEVIARDRLDQILIRTQQEASDAGDPALAAVAVAALLDLREKNAAFLLETGDKACVRFWTQTRFEVQSAFDVIVRHSLSDETDATGLALQVEHWYTELHEEGVVDGVSVGGLRDRILIYTEARQLYGTHRTCIEGQWVYDPPVSDPDELESRRNALRWPEAASVTPGGACGGRAE